MYTYIIIIICTRRRNSRPVNINHIVTRSRTIIRSATVLLHGRRRRRLWSAAFNVFQPTFRRWKTEKLIRPLSPPSPNSRLPKAGFRVPTAANHTIIRYDVYLQIWGRIFLSIMRTTVYAPFFIRMIHFYILPTARIWRVNTERVGYSSEKEKIMFF